MLRKLRREPATRPHPDDNGDAHTEDAVDDHRFDEKDAGGKRPWARGGYGAVGSYTPGMRARLGVEDKPSRVRAVLKQAALLAIRLVGQVTAWLRAYAPIVRDRAVELWARRPRSRDEAAELAQRGRAEARRQWPVVRAWTIQHRVLVGGMTAVLVFASADGALGLIPTDAAVGPGVAVRIPVQYPLQLQATQESSKRYLDAINNGEHLREQAVVSAAAAATLERAKAEAAAAVAGQPQPWLTPSPDATLPPGFVLPGVGGFALPAKGLFTSGFGARWGTFHAGIDIAAPLGSPIYAVAAGTVIDAGPAQGFGLWVRIRHDDGAISVYGHMYDFSVSVGERVPAGLQIARIGNRGDSTGPHLHFEIIINGQHVDPQPWLAQRGIVLG
ncbi:M23 family metallopeptidase [Nocardia tengchongensis]|uniref:M23 family metallopeptidase n=1 Tax=Nocardia tengchongensis TaxID=2055889 RepID=UPI0036A09527